MPPKKASASTKEKTVTKSKAPPKTKITKAKVQEEEIESAEPTVAKTRGRRGKNVEDNARNTEETKPEPVKRRGAIAKAEAKEIAEADNEEDVEADDEEINVKDKKSSKRKAAAVSNGDAVPKKAAKSSAKKKTVEENDDDDKTSNNNAEIANDEDDEPPVKDLKKASKRKVAQKSGDVVDNKQTKTTTRGKKAKLESNKTEDSAKPVKKTKKNSKDDDDETEEPVTKPAKKTSKKTIKGNADEAEEPVTKPAKKASKKTIKDDVDETEEPVAKPAKKASKRTIKDDVDETEEPATEPAEKTVKRPVKDDDETEKPVTKPAAKKRTKKIVKEDDDDDSGVEESSTKTSKKASKATEKKPMNKTETDWENLNFSCETKSKSGQPANFHITAWNVNGVRAWVKKGGLDILQQDKPDIFCLQETKCTTDKLPEELIGMTDYKAYWCSSEKDGYAGVGILSKLMPIEVHYGIESPEHDEEGRCITAEFKKFYLVNVYVPNSGRNLVTLSKRLDWNIAFKAFIKKLGQKKPVIICGDMNVAHAEIDLANPKQNVKTAGFTPEEREGMTDFLSEGYIDTFRELYPDKADSYTFWNYMHNARSKNIGWRIDYFIITPNLSENVCDNIIHSEVMGSDHCPISLHLNI